MVRQGMSEVPTKDLTKDKDDKQLINASYKIDLVGKESQVKSKHPKSNNGKLNRCYSQ